MRNGQNSRIHRFRQNTAGQCQRRDDCTDQRDGECVGNRADDGNAPEKKHRQRDKAYRQRPLCCRRHRQGMSEPAQPRRIFIYFPAPSAGGIQDHADSAERQPETRLQQSPRIEKADNSGSSKQGMRKPCQPPCPECDGHDDDHAKCPSGRDAETGQCDIGKSHDNPGNGGRFLGWKDQRPLFSGEKRPAPECSRQQGKQAGDHGDVQAGYGNQMRDACPVEDFPVGLRNRFLVPNDKRDDDSGVFTVRQCTVYPFTQDASYPVDPVHRRGVE